MVAERVILQQWKVRQVTIVVRNDYIIEYTVDPNVYVTLEDQMVITGSIIERLGSVKKYAMIVDTGEFTTHSPESTRYAREVEDETPLVCVAILSRNLASRLAANVYMRIFKPGYPMQLFATIEEAEVWCQKHLRQRGTRGG